MRKKFIWTVFQAKPKIHPTEREFKFRGLCGVATLSKQNACRGGQQSVEILRIGPSDLFETSFCFLSCLLDEIWWCKIKLRFRMELRVEGAAIWQGESSWLPKQIFPSFLAFYSKVIDWFSGGVERHLDVSCFCGFFLGISKKCLANLLVLWEDFWSEFFGEDF